jgi:putative chitinase
MNVSTETVARAMGAGKWAQPIEAACIRFGVETELEKCHLLAQLGHESDGFRTAQEYASGAKYEGRKDLGNTQPGDGKRFKGRGLIQITGRTNYTAYSSWKYGDDRCVRDPSMLEEPQEAVDASLWYWKIFRPACSRKALLDDVEGVTRAINGGLNGLVDRKARLAHAKELFAKIRAVRSPDPNR